MTVVILLPNEKTERRGRPSVSAQATDVFARVHSSDFVRCVSREPHFIYEIVSVDDAIVCVLKIVRELVSRLIQLDVIRAGHDHHDDPSVFALLDGTSELRALRT